MRRADENGYVLITAIWLLALCGAIAAMLMLRSLDSARIAHDQARQLMARIALQSAIETVIADRLFKQNHSRWWVLPAQGSVDVAGQAVQVYISDDAGRIDLNEADSALIDQALRGAGVDGAARARFGARLAYLRASRRRLLTSADMAALCAPLSCPRGLFTLATGLAQPRAAQISSALSPINGLPGTSGGPAQPGDSIRYEARSGGMTLTVIARESGLSSKPYALSEWRRVR